MHIVFGLRRKRDEIAATIAAYEARIDASRMDLAALERAARLSDPEGTVDEMARRREFERPEAQEANPAAEREVWESKLPSVRRQSTPPVARAKGFTDQEAHPLKPIEVQTPRVTGEDTCSATVLAGERIPAEFFYLNWP
jgi:hypothetical protein